ncbi:MAG TPA: polysaccharide pyruvyl transferase CsaB [Candidatus Obscuribacterales bacterium]
MVLLLPRERAILVIAIRQSFSTSVPVNSTIPKEKEEAVGARGRKLVLVSGYYGFGNLGDEAILEEIVNELKRLVPPGDIVILSNTPERHAELFGVKAIYRWSFPLLLRQLPKARLFLSGGGGLFQDVTSVNSTVFYALQILLARCFFVPVLFYAQGLGPLKTAIGTFMTRIAAKLSQSISVRDAVSKELLKSWQIEAHLTADPVWALEAEPLPNDVQAILASQMPEGKNNLRLALSLRKSHNLTPELVETLVEALASVFPPDACLVLLPLQESLDNEYLGLAEAAWKAKGRPAFLLQTARLERPSQWLSLMAQFDIVVAMRLHAGIMALKAGVPVVGIAYDPKVQSVLEEFGQPILNLPKENGLKDTRQIWEKTMKAALEDVAALSRAAGERSQHAKNLACQNFHLIAKILGMQSDPHAS